MYCTNEVVSFLSGVKNDIHVFRFGRGLTSLSGDSNDTEPVVYGWER